MPTLPGAKFISYQVLFFYVRMMVGSPFGRKFEYIATGCFVNIVWYDLNGVDGGPRGITENTIGGHLFGSIPRKGPRPSPSNIG